MRLLTFTPDTPYRNVPRMRVYFTDPADVAPPVSQKDCFIRFLIGPNGVGKSNLLRFLAMIYAALDDGYQGPDRGNPAYLFPFQLDYELGGRTISITSEGRGHAGMKYVVDGKPIELERDILLPAMLLIYTSGNEEIWRKTLYPSDEDVTSVVELPQTLVALEDEEPLMVSLASMSQDDRPPQEDDAPEEDESQDKDHQQDQTKSSRRGRERTFLVESQHLPLAFLTALCYWDDARQQMERSAYPKMSDFTRILDHINVEDFLGFSFEVIEGAINGLADADRRFLDHLGKHAMVFKHPQAKGYRFVYDVHRVDTDGQPTSSGLVNAPENERLQPFQFLRRLVALQEAGVLQSPEIVLNINRQGQSRTLLASALSDGELAFLHRMALIFLLSEQECLFFFDEPEVHFNDVWKRDLIYHIEQTLADTPSEFILTTHESLTLTDAFSSEIILLGENVQYVAPQTFGAEPGEVLLSAFQSPKTVGTRADRLLSDALDNPNLERLNQLFNQVGPGYFRFRLMEEILKLAPPN